jgi:hypothetical protein
LALCTLSRCQLSKQQQHLLMALTMLLPLPPPPVQQPLSPPVQQLQLQVAWFAMTKAERSASVSLAAVATT